MWCNLALKCLVKYMYQPWIAQEYTCFAAGQQSVFMHIEIIRVYAFISHGYYVPRPFSHLRVCYMVLQVTHIRVRENVHNSLVVYVDRPMHAFTEICSMSLYHGCYLVRLLPWEGTVTDILLFD